MGFLISILKKVYNYLGIKGQGGFWGQALGIGTSLYGATQKGEKSGGEFKTLEPREYEEANKAREMWLQNLQKWGGMESFGATAPNWEDIWEQARQKVRGFWQGTPTTAGAMDKIKAEKAKRNISGGPEMTKAMLAAGAEQGRQLEGISVQQALAKAQFGERGRMNWLQSMQNLAGERAPQPQAVYVPETTDNSKGDALMGFGGAMFDYFGQKSLNKKPPSQPKTDIGTSGGYWGGAK